MENINELEVRAYFLVMYNILPIQKGIQAGHAIEEYSDKYSESPIYKRYRQCKTWIILNGGTSNDGRYDFHGHGKQLGSMEEHLSTLRDNNIDHVPFFEPDLNNSLSSIAFLVDERVFDHEKYPDFIDYVDKKTHLSSECLVRYRLGKINIEEDFPSEYVEWIELIGGKKNEFLRTFLKQFILA